jgi:hypothetical protein
MRGCDGPVTLLDDSVIKKARASGWVTAWQGTAGDGR